MHLFLPETDCVPCTKSQWIRRTSNFGTKFAQKVMNYKTFEKTHHKFIVRI